MVMVVEICPCQVGFQNNATPGQRNVMQTPTIDALSREGIVLTDYTVFRYVCVCVCVCVCVFVSVNVNVCMCVGVWVVVVERTFMDSPFSSSHITLVV